MNNYGKMRKIKEMGDIMAQRGRPPKGEQRRDRAITMSFTAAEVAIMDDTAKALGVSRTAAVVAGVFDLYQRRVMAISRGGGRRNDDRPQDDDAEDRALMQLAIERAQEPQGRTFTQEDIMQEAGITQEELDAMPEVEIG